MNVQHPNCSSDRLSYKNSSLKWCHCHPESS